MGAQTGYFFRVSMSIMSSASLLPCGTTCMPPPSPVARPCPPRSMFREVAHPRAQAVQHVDRLVLPTLGPQPLQLAPQRRRLGFAVQRTHPLHDCPLVPQQELPMDDAVYHMIAAAGGV